MSKPGVLLVAFATLLFIVGVDATCPAGATLTCNGDTFCCDAAAEDSNKCSHDCNQYDTPHGSDVIVVDAFDPQYCKEWSPYACPSPPAPSPSTPSPSTPSPPAPSPSTPSPSTPSPSVPSPSVPEPAAEGECPADRKQKCPDDSTICCDKAALIEKKCVMNSLSIPGYINKNTGTIHYGGYGGGGDCPAGSTCTYKCNVGDPFGLWPSQPSFTVPPEAAPSFTFPPTDAPIDGASTVASQITQSNAPSNDSDGLGAGAIVGIAIASAAGFALLAYLVYTQCGGKGSSSAMGANRANYGTNNV